MTLNHESLPTQSVLNGMRANARRQAANTFSGLGVPPTPATTQLDPVMILSREEAIPAEPHHEPVLL